MSVSTIKDNLPPGPKGSPLFGSLREFRHDALGFLQDLKAGYGDLATFRLGRTKFVQVSHPEHIRRILVTDHAQFERSGVLRAQPVIGRGLITSDGDFHRRQRRLVQPAFTPKRVLSYAPVMTAAALRVADLWRDGEVRDIAEDMVQVTLEVVTRSLFSADLGSEADQVEAAMTSVLEHFSRLLTSPRARLLSRVPFSFRSFHNARRYLDQLVFRMIDERREKPGDRGDVLSMLLSARDVEGDGGRMDDVQVRDEVMTLFTAGHETMATALAWTWYCLAKNPDVEAKLCAELNAVLGGRVPTADDVPHLEYTRMVFAESMRMYPPVWGTTRRVVRDYELGGYRIPAGTIIGMSQYLVHNDARFYRSPEEFDPSRWLAEAAAERPKFSYFPFGGGPRLCIGEPFAWMEGVLVLATLAQNWSMQLVPGHPIAFQPLLSLRPRHGIRMTLHRRGNSQIMRHANLMTSSAGG